MKVTGRILPKFPKAVCVIILCAFLSIFCGFLIDRRDKKKIFALSLSVMAVSYLIFPGMSNGFLILGILMVINIASSSLAIVTNSWFALVTFMSLFFSSVLPYDEAYQRVAYISALNAAIVMGMQYFVSAVIRKKTIMRWVRFAVGSMMAGLIILIFRSDLLWLTAAIVLLSFGEVAIVPAEYLFIIKITPKEQRGVYLGAQNMIVLGLSISPVLCGYLLKEATASVMFAVLCVILVFSLAFYQMGYSVSEKTETI